MSKLNRKEHNVSTLMYHKVCPAKYRRAVISKGVDKKLREICLGIEARFEITFLEIGTERDHVHYLVQCVPTYSPEKIVRTIKSLTARKIFESCPEVKKMLLGGEFWTRGTVGEHGSEQVIREYVVMGKTCCNHPRIGHRTLVEGRRGMHLPEYNKFCPLPNMSGNRAVIWKTTRSYMR